MVVLMGSAQASNDFLTTNMKHGVAEENPTSIERQESGQSVPSRESVKLQALLCETRSPNPSVMTLAIRNKLSKVGGWFSVRRTLELLDEDAIFERNLKKDKGDSDIYFDRPSDLALELLPIMLPQASIPKPGNHGHNKAELVRSWKHWISEHQSELEKMQPTGAGVDFSQEACKKGKPTNKSHGTN
ncbi:MAG TPA: hypothetical protein VJT08_21090 [Terriglobales bacterium]|nr:hypothetical protein [Terriglobales bacterium]